MDDRISVDVFISYSSKNKNVADAVVSDFEQNGIRCWYAPRDILPGKEWVTAIKEGIYSAKVFVLLFTEESNTSRQVMNEVAMAFNAEKTIVPFKLTKEEMSEKDQGIFLPALYTLEKTNLERIEKEIERVKGEVARAQGKLSNEKFVQKAPEAVVNEERRKLDAAIEMLKRLEERRADLN